MFVALKHCRRRPAARSRKPLHLENLEPRFLLSSYSVVDLGFLPGEFHSQFQDINNTGQVVGYCGERAMVWTPTSAGGVTGVMTDLGVPTGYDGALAKAISSNALIAGTAYQWGVSATTTVPCVWIPDSTGCSWTLQIFGTAASPVLGEALGVNQLGTVVGTVVVDSTEHACVWESDGSGGYVTTDLNAIFPSLEVPDLPGNGTFWIHEAAAINDINQIVANGLYLEDADGDGYAEVSRQWGFLVEDPDNDGFHTGEINVTNLGALGSRQYTYVTDINNQGQIVGSSAGARNNQGWHAFLWQNEVMQDLGTLPKDVSSYALGISDTGLVVGYSEQGAATYPHPFLWQNGRMTDLSTMIPADSGWLLRQAYAVNDQGEIVGIGEDPRTDHYSWPLRGFLLSTSATLPTISIGDVSVTEGDSGTTAVQLEVTLSEPPGPGQTVSVDYYTTGCYNDSATAGLDFITAAGTVSFAEGKTSQVVTVQVKGDLLAGVNADVNNNTDLGNEYFYVNLANPRNSAGVQAAVFLDAQAMVTILEDEPAMSISDVAYLEGNDGLTPFTFTVLLSVPAKDTVSVEWHTEDNTAKAGEDYKDYVAAEDELVIPAGDSSGTFTVWVIGDPVKEDWEVFSVWLDKATVENAYIPNLSNRTGGFAWGRIENDDRATKPVKPKSSAARLSLADADDVDLLAASQYEPMLDAPKGNGLAATGRVNAWLYAALQDTAWTDNDDPDGKWSLDDELLQMLAYETAIASSNGIAR